MPPHQFFKRSDKTEEAVLISRYIEREKTVSTKDSHFTCHYIPATNTYKWKYHHKYLILFYLELTIFCFIGREWLRTNFFFRYFKYALKSTHLKKQQDFLSQVESETWYSQSQLSLGKEDLARALWQWKGVIQELTSVRNSKITAEAQGSVEM